MNGPLRIATGSGRLALARAEAVLRDLSTAWPDLEIAPPIPLEASDSDGEASRLRAMLREGLADLALQAFDALPLGAAPGIALAAVPLRSDPREALVSSSGVVLQYLGEGSKVAAHGARRQGQLLRRRSDLIAEPIPDDIAQGLERLDAGAYDAIILVAADLEHLGLRSRICERFDHDQMIPAPGQGALALEARAGEAQLAALLAPLHDANTAYSVAAERACLAALGAEPDGSVGVHAITDGEGMVVYGIVLSADGSRTARMQWSGPARDAVDLGETLAELLRSIGADKILAGEPIPPTGRYSIR